MVTLCIEGKKIVNKCQEALLYDGCNKWQHRTCRRGVSRDMYRNAVKSREDIPWRCKPCSTFPCSTIVCLRTTVVAWSSFRPPFHQRSLTGHREVIKLWNPHFSNLPITRTKSRSLLQSKAVISRNLTGNTVKYDSSAGCRQWYSSIFTKYFNL